MDYTNGHYIPNLVPGVLQPLEELSDQETDEFLSTIDIEALVKEAENSTGGIPNNPIPAPAEKDLKHFGNITSAEMLKDVSNHSFSAATKRKAMWVARIFDQWKCIHNYKLKVDSSLTYPEIKGTLINMDLDLMCDTLCIFIMEIRKQSGEEYPHETLYEIMLSLQNFLAMNGCTVKLLDHNSFIKLRNTLDNKMKELSSAGVIRHKK